MREGPRHRWVGLHRLARRRQAARARARAGDLRPAALAVARARDGRHRARLDHRSRGAGARAAQLRRGRPSRRRRRRQRRPRRARGRRARQRPRHRGGARGGSPRRGQADRLREHDLGLLGLRRTRRSTRTRCCRRPSHLYTSTKLAGELYCKAYQELYGIDYTILRFGIPYGPRAREAAVIPAFVSKAFAGEPLTLAGDGSQSRRFVYVEDLADGRRARARATWRATASTTSPATRT